MLFATPNYQSIGDGTILGHKMKLTFYETYAVGVPGGGAAREGGEHDRGKRNGFSSSTKFKSNKIQVGLMVWLDLTTKYLRPLP